MGPDESGIENFVMCPINPDGSFGEPVQLEKLKTVELDGLELGTDSPDNSMYKNSIKFLSGTMSGTLKCNLPSKMSRKKFKKWLMHFPWINRNEAETYCHLITVAKGRISYGTTYHDTAFIIPFERPVIALCNSFTKQLKETEK